MTRADIPNIISILRIGLVLPVTAALLDAQYMLALSLYTVAGLSDGLDGYLAKRYQWTSRLGSILDPLADKLLLVCTYLALAWSELMPWWLVTAVVLRDLVILSGAIAYHVLVGEYEMAPTPSSKINTFFQILVGLLVVLSESLFKVPEWVLDSLFLVVLVTTFVSGISYVWTWGVRARSQWSTGEGRDDVGH